MLKQSPKQTAIARELRKADTWAEQLLWRWLRDRRFSAYKFRRQHPMGPHVLDFFCNEAKLNIELDGSQHGHPEHAQADAERDRWLEERGINVLRYWNGRLRREMQVVRDAIWQALQERAPKPLPDYCRPGVVGAKGPGEDTAHDRFALLPLPLGEGGTPSASRPCRAGPRPRRISLPTLRATHRPARPAPSGKKSAPRKSPELSQTGPSPS